MGSENKIDFEQTKEALITVGTLAVEAIANTIKQIYPALEIIYEGIWMEYRTAGMPYGETDDGLLRWVKEIGEVKRSQLEAKRILQHHQMLADLRHKLNSLNPT